MKKLFTILYLFSVSTFLAAQNTCPEINLGKTFNYVCSFQNLPLVANVTNAASYSWSTIGTGTIANPGSLSTNYRPTIADSTEQYLTFAFTATSAQGCQKSDTINFYLQTTTSVSAGPDQLICYGDSIALHGNYKYANKGAWTTTGRGELYSYPPADSVAVYIATAADKAAGKVALTFTASANGNCKATTDSIYIYFSQYPMLRLESENVACDSIKINAIGSLGQTTWGHTGSGYFIQRENTFAQYVISPGDVAKTNILIYASHRAPGNCAPTVDTILVTPYAAVQVEAGEYQSFTETDTIKLNGTASNTPNVSWTTDGSGSFTPNNTSLKSYYLPTPADKDRGYLIFNLSADANAYCPAKQDQLGISFENRFSIGGTINYQPASPVAGKVILYKQSGSPSTFVVESSIPFDTLGRFEFSNLRNGKYLVLAQPVANSTHSFVPTYYASSSTWENATAVEVNFANTSPISFTLIKGISTNTTWNTGTDSISGNVIESTPLARVTAATPVPDATVSLYDNSGRFLGYVYTDYNGYYTFQNLIAGSYSVKVEYAGKTGIAEKVVADGNPATPGEANFEVNPTAVTALLDLTKSIELDFYPNPVTDQLNVQNPFAGQHALQISISNSTGIEVYNGEFTNTSHLTVGTQSLPVGLYLLKISNGEKTATNKFLKN